MHGLLVVEVVVFHIIKSHISSSLFELSPNKIKQVVVTISTEEFEFEVI